MCGISAILSGVNLSGYAAERNASGEVHPQLSKVEIPTLWDIWKALESRGPDHIGQQTILFGIDGQKSCENDKEDLHKTAAVPGKLLPEYLHEYTDHITAISVNKLMAELPIDGAVCNSDPSQSSLPCVSMEDQSSTAKLQLVGSTLQLRGSNQVAQPLRDEIGNVLIYNGEIFGGLSVGPEENDSAKLLLEFKKCCSCSCHSCPGFEESCSCMSFPADSKVHATIPQVLSQLRGPWALIYWQAESQSLWFGRDAFGRRSLLVHWPSYIDPRLVLASVAPQQSTNLSVTAEAYNNSRSFCSGGCSSGLDRSEDKNIFPCSDFGGRKKTRAFAHEEMLGTVESGFLKPGEAINVADSKIHDYWEELPCGIYSVSMHNSLPINSQNLLGRESGEATLLSPSSMYASGVVKKYDWQDDSLSKLLQWKRRVVEPNNATSKADQNGYWMGKYNKENNSIVMGDVHIHSGIPELKSDLGDIRLKDFDIDLQRSLDPETKEALLSFEAHNEDAARYLECKDGQPNDAHEPSKQRSLLDMFSKALIQDEVESEQCAVQRVQEALKEAVRRRTSNIRRPYQDIIDKSKSDGLNSSIFSDYNAPVAILFSGGLDSMLLAVLADQCLQPDCAIELLNVSFEGPLAPDRRTAIAGIAELKELSPQRRWILVEVDSCLHEQELQSRHLLSLICPSNTYMDFNIGTALWFAARGDGWIDMTLHPDLLHARSISNIVEGKREMGLHCSKDHLYKSCSSCGRDETKTFTYKSQARVLLVGTGADEQCAGYSRYRTKFKVGGWNALQEEMKLDMQRIWKRNMGRDDRCIADNGKEARFPFLDEDVVTTMLDLPLWHIADLTKGLGVGDKKILRKVASNLGLTKSSCLPKRAIQFGSRIARESNRRDFGSNRAANRASVGSRPLSTLL